jgi:hypothetical protein
MQRLSTCRGTLSIAEALNQWPTARLMQDCATSCYCCLAKDTLPDSVLPSVLPDVLPDILALKAHHRLLPGPHSPLASTAGRTSSHLKEVPCSNSIPLVEPSSGFTGKHPMCFRSDTHVPSSTSTIHMARSYRRCATTHARSKRHCTLCIGSTRMYCRA